MYIILFLVKLFVLKMFRYLEKNMKILQSPPHEIGYNIWVI